MKKTDNKVYEVEFVCGRKIVKNEILYKIKWKGYNRKTWEPFENL